MGFDQMLCQTDRTITCILIIKIRIFFFFARSKKFTGDYIGSQVFSQVQYFQSSKKIPDPGIEPEHANHYTTRTKISEAKLLKNRKTGRIYVKV